MDHESKMLAMNAISSAAKLFKEVGYLKMSAMSAVYLAKIRQEDRARLGGRTTSYHSVQEIHQQSTVVSVQNVRAQTIYGRE